LQQVRRQCGIGKLVIPKQTNGFCIDEVGINRTRNSVGAEDTFVQDIADLDLATAELRALAEKLWRYCEAQGISGKTVTVKIKYSDSLRRRAAEPAQFRWRT
jgi:nucleotidyltransferase/DNA polymerase involved in DNA repair